MSVSSKLLYLGVREYRQNSVDLKLLQNNLQHDWFKEIFL